MTLKYLSLLHWLCHLSVHLPFCGWASREAIPPCTCSTICERVGDNFEPICELACLGLRCLTGIRCSFGTCLSPEKCLWRGRRRHWLVGAVVVEYYAYCVFAGMGNCCKSNYQGFTQRITDCNCKTDHFTGLPFRWFHLDCNILIRGFGFRSNRLVVGNLSIESVGRPWWCSSCRSCYLFGRWFGVLGPRMLLFIDFWYFAVARVHSGFGSRWTFKSWNLAVACWSRQLPLQTQAWSHRCSARCSVDSKAPKKSLMVGLRAWGHSRTHEYAGNAAGALQSTLATACSPA